MATTSPVKKSKKAKANRADNFRRGEAPKYTPAMRAELKKQVAAATKAKEPTREVYERLAAAWSKKHGQEYTANQVSSQYYFSKSQLRAKARRRAEARISETITVPPIQVQATATKPKPAAKPSSNGHHKLPAPLVDLAAMIESIQLQLTEAQADAKAQARRAAAAERALERARKALL